MSGSCTEATPDCRKGRSGSTAYPRTCSKALRTAAVAASWSALESERTPACGRQMACRQSFAATTRSAPAKGPRLLLLAGQSWRVTWTDWKRRRCFVEPADGGGLARWTSLSSGGASFALSRAIREVLLGADPPARLTRRAETALAEAREAALDLVHPGGTVIVRESSGDVRWWNWAGWHANATLIPTLSGIADQAQRIESFYIRLRSDCTPQTWKAQLDGIEERMCLPAVDDKALDGLKFSDALPRHIAEATLAQRLADLEGARTALADGARYVDVTAAE